MTRAYIRLDPAFDERKESYPDGAYAALVATFCLAEAQPNRGRFRSLDYLRRLLGRRGRYVTYLLDKGDIVELPDGRIYVEGWDEWQEGDWKVGERVKRIRNRDKRNGGCNGLGNAPGNGSPSSAGGGAGGAKQSGALTAERAPAKSTGSKDPDERSERAARAYAVLENPLATPALKQAARDQLASLGIDA